MTQDSSNSTIEMGTSDQVLVATKAKSKLPFIIGGIAMVIGIGVVVALVVVFSGNESVGEDITTTTQAPTSVTTTTSSTTTTVTTPEGTTPTLPTIAPTTPPVTEPESTTETITTITPPEEQIVLEDIVNGVFAPPSFNGSWTSGSDVLFRNANGDLVQYDVDTDSTTVLISNTSQILQLSSRVQQLSPDGTQVILAYNVASVYRHSFLAHYAAFDVFTGNITYISPSVNYTDALLQNFVWGPSGTSFAYVYQNNIFYQENLEADPLQITDNGVMNVTYNGIPDWVYEEEVFGSNNALWFSSDGSKIAFATFDDIDVKIMKVPHYGVPGSVGYQYTQHHEIRYPKPGTVNPTVSVTIRDLDSNTVSVYSQPSDLEQAILRNVRFVNNDTVAIMWTDRVQTQLKVELCTLGQSACVEIFTYVENDGWVDNIPFLFNSAGNSFITILPQAVNGVPYKQVVQVSDTNVANALWTSQDRSNTAHTVLEILLWTSDDIIWYKATSVNDSSEQHIYNVDADGEVSCFTCNIIRADGGECSYNEAVINTDATRVTVNCAGPSVPQVLIYDTNGSLLRVWDDNAEVSALVDSRFVPQIIRRSVPVADGYPDADVHIQVPNNYQDRSNVPLLVYVYGGPDSALVTKQWSIDWGTSLVNRWGIAVAHIDGRGSGLRGVANTFALNRRLGSVEIEDQINVTKYLHETEPWLDSNRTCIWGWSYGGYAASLALARGGDVFRCGVAVAPVVDWRFYDTIYTERYMDVPQNNSAAYDESSLLTNEVVEAYRNKRYFLIHGTEDDNVHYQHAMLISRLLQRQDVYFTQMSYTDEDHGLVGVRPHLYHAMEKFLQENML